MLPPDMSSKVHDKTKWESETPKIRRKMERVCERDTVTALSLANVALARGFWFSLGSDIEIVSSPSPPLPLGYIVVWGRAKKHLCGQSALSGSVSISMFLTIQPGWAEALARSLHLQVLLPGARGVRSVDLKHLRYSNPALYLPDT